MVPEGGDELSKNDKLREFKLSGSDCIPKIKNSDGGSTLISDILTQMLVPPFSLEILRKLPYFVFFITESL